jgi:hypothetical protein
LKEVCALAFCPSDSQKLAKHAVYSLHRAEFDKAEQQMKATGAGAPPQLQNTAKFHVQPTKFHVHVALLVLSQ